MVLTYLMNNNLQELIISVKTRLATKYFDKSAANHLFFTNNGKSDKKTLWRLIGTAETRHKNPPENSEGYAKIFM